MELDQEISESSDEEDIDEWNVGAEANVGPIFVEGLVFNKNHSG